MQPFGLPDTDPAAARIREAAARGALSHALLFSGAGPRLAAARFAAAAMECAALEGRPCGVCAECRRVLADFFAGLRGGEKNFGPQI